MILKKARMIDLLQIMKLNNGEAKWVGKKNRVFFEKYLNIPYFYLVLIDKNIAGFAMVMNQGTKYDSPNFLWFKKKFPKFYYIDRIIISKKYRKKGLAKKLYSHIFSKFSNKNLPITAEVSLVPKNNSSIIFHKKQRFKTIGKLTSKGKTCDMLVWRKNVK
jgi:hypothetical protein